MNNEFSTIEDQLKKVSVQNLSNEEKQTLWVSIAREHATRPTVSPYSWMMLVHRRVMVTVSAILIFVLAGGSTVALADGAKPGDTLFALDRATENVALALAPESKKDSVRVSVANERIDELESLISDEFSRRLAQLSDIPQVPVDSAPEATLMMGAVPADVPTVSEDVGGQAPLEDARTFYKQGAQDDASSTEDVAVEVEKKDKKRSDIEEALLLVDEISSELEKRGNKEGHDSVRRAMKRLSGKLDELPSEEHDEFKESFKNIPPEAGDAFQPENDDDSNWTNEDGFLSPPNPQFEDDFDDGDFPTGMQQGGGSVGNGTVQGTSTGDSLIDNNGGQEENDGEIDN